MIRWRALVGLAMAQSAARAVLGVGLLGAVVAGLVATTTDGRTLGLVLVASGLLMAITGSAALDDHSGELASAAPICRRARWQCGIGVTAAVAAVSFAAIVAVARLAGGDGAIDAALPRQVALSGAAWAVLGWASAAWAIRCLGSPGVGLRAGASLILGLHVTYPVVAQVLPGWATEGDGIRWWALLATLGLVALALAMRDPGAWPRPLRPAR